MELTNEQKKSQELLQTVITKAWEDQSFKEELISNPIYAIEKATGERINLPEGKTLIVKDQTNAATVYINIPTEPSLEDMELSENQLEIVAGGGSIWPPFISIPTIPTNPDKDGYQL